ncbi:MAG: class I mannose-6-phosphate isomerase, partial [Pirellulales bacterium]|nr:class I mannose-6-phosphate isomerase [Pirellulales bacterium]
MLGKQLGEGDDYAESWEIVDHGEDQSRVAAGPLKGTTLGELVSAQGPALLGRHHPQPFFPLLFKFLDAARTLSVQVHPDDAAAARLDPPDLGKTEAWVVLATEPGALIYAGLKPGCDRDTLARALDGGS